MFFVFIEQEVPATYTDNTNVNTEAVIRTSEVTEQEVMMQMGEIETEAVKQTEADILRVKQTSDVTDEQVVKQTVENTDRKQTVETSEGEQALKQIEAVDDRKAVSETVDLVDEFKLTADMEADTVMVKASSEQAVKQTVECKEKQKSRLQCNEAALYTTEGLCCYCKHL